MIRTSLLSAGLAALTSLPAAADEPYEEDFRFALEKLEDACGHFFHVKDIDWKKVEKEFTKVAKSIETPEEHLRQLWRLLARLEDGHASVTPLAKGEGIQVAEWQRERVSPGFHVCQDGKKYFIKTVFGSAQEVGITPGMEIVKIDGEKPGRWFDAKIEEITDIQSFSTDHQARLYAFHWGLAAEPDSRLKLELEEVDGKKRKRTITYDNDKNYHHGPAATPDGLEHLNSLYHGILPSGFGYVHVRWCKGSLPEDMDVALARLGSTPGLILDFRGNSGGGFDHDALFSRFVPEGHTFGTGKAYPSAGQNPYTGPVVVIVDATVRSAGETASGMFKEDGRAYMIGETPTAGMSSSKTTIELPSGLFALYVSVASNKSRFQQGRGIEGIGIEPHEIVPYDPEDLAAGIDTQIRHAEELLADFPQKEVPYDPKDFGL